jgi:hypothetical protein
MYKRTIQWTWSKALTDAMLAALSAVPGAALLTTPKLILFTNNGPVLPTSAVADFTVPTFTGYAAATITLAGPVAIGGNDRALVATLRFIATADTSPAQTIYGVLMTNGSTTFYGGELFDTPLNIALNGQFIDYDLIVPLPTIYVPNVA